MSHRKIVVAHAEGGGLEGRGGADAQDTVGRRRRFLTYMQKHDLEGYRALIKELGLRR